MTILKDKPNLDAKLAGGEILRIYAEPIVKDFPFAEGETRSYEAANALAEAARKDEQYFLEENLRALKSRRDTFRAIADGSERRFAARLKHSFYGGCFCAEIDYIANIPQNECIDMATALEIMQVYDKAIELRTKRLRRYLKRFGLSKVNAWTFWDMA